MLEQLQQLSQGRDPWMGAGPCACLRYITKNADVGIGLDGLSEINFDMFADVVYQDPDFAADLQFSKRTGSALTIKPGVTAPYAWLEIMPVYRVWARCPVPITPSLTVTPKAGLGQEPVFSIAASYDSELVSVKTSQRWLPATSAVHSTVNVRPWGLTVVCHYSLKDLLNPWNLQKLTVQGKYGMVGFMGTLRVARAHVGPVTLCAHWGRSMGNPYKFASCKYRSGGKSVSLAFRPELVSHPSTLWAKFKSRISDRLTCGMRIRVDPKDIGTVTLCPCLTLTSDS